MSIRDNEIRDNQKKSRVTFHIQNFREYCNIFVCVFAYIKLEIELHSIHSKHLPENHLSLRLSLYMLLNDILYILASKDLENKSFWKCAS